MNSKVKKTAAIGLLAVAVAIGGYQAIRWLGDDPDLLPGDSVGMIAAVEYLPQDSKVVVFKPDGTMFEFPHKDGAQEKSPIWRTDGQRLFFLSNRDEDTFHIYRWRPGDADASRRSLGATNRSEPWFGPVNDPNANKTALITSRGLIMEYDPKTGNTFQLVPPGKAIGSNAGNESKDARFSGAYAAMGRAFTKARWAGSRKWIIAIVQRNVGEVLVAQDMEMKGEGEDAKLPPPFPVVAGESVDFDVAEDGTVVASVRGFRWFLPDYEDAQPPEDVIEQFIPEQFRAGGKITTPYLNGMMAFNPTAGGQLQVLFASPDDKVAFGSPSISPDGKGIAFPVGPLAGERFIPKTLSYYPIGGNPQTDVRTLAKEGTESISWTADSNTVVYTKLDQGKRSLWKIAASGGDPIRISPEGRNIGSAVVSPQVAKSAPK